MKETWWEKEDRIREECIASNQKVQCRLKIKGAFGLTCGEKELCLMLGKTINVSFPNTTGDEDLYHCERCPDPEQRQDLLEIYEDTPDCSLCAPYARNLATMEVPEDVELFPGERLKKGDQVCVSCFQRVRYHFMHEDAALYQEELAKLEQDYREGKIPYSALVDFKERRKEIQ